MNSAKHHPRRTAAAIDSVGAGKERLPRSSGGSEGKADGQFRAAAPATMTSLDDGRLSSGDENLARLQPLRALQECRRLYLDVALELAPPRHGTGSNQLRRRRRERGVVSDEHHTHVR